MSGNPFMPQVEVDVGPLTRILDGIRRLAQRLYSTESERLAVGGGPNGAAHPGPSNAVSAAQTPVSPASSQAQTSGPLGAAQVARRADDEPTRRARWIPAFRLPERIRWGMSRATRYRASGEPYIVVPIGADQGAPSFRTISPSSPGWVIPARLVDIEEGDEGRPATGASSAARGATSAARPAYSRALTPMSPTQVTDRREDQGEAPSMGDRATQGNQTAATSAGAQVEVATGGAMQRAFARIYAALFGGSDE